MRIDAPSITGSFIVNNATLPDISGLATVSGNTFTGNQVINGTIVATGTTLVSGSAQVSYTGITNIPSGIVSSSAQTIANLPSGVVSGSAQTIANLPSGVVSGSAQVTTFGFGTTGSNTFQGSQTINGSLVVTGSLTAQQFIVSSSVTYLTESFASGSHKFGDSSDDTHQFTGSVVMSGNLSVTGSITSIGSVPLLKLTNTSAGAGAGSIQFYSGSNQMWNLGTHTNNDMYLYNNTTTTYNIWVQNSNGYVGINKSSGTTNSQLDVNGNAIISGSLTTTGDLTINSNGAIFNRTSSGEPYLFFRKDGVNRGSIYGITGGGLRMFDQGDNQVFTMTGSMIGISDTTPSKKLTVNFGANISDGIMVTGSQRQESIFKSTGEHSNLVVNSAHSNIYLPTIGLERNSTRLGEIRLQRASNSDNYSTFTESEMVIGTTTQTPTSLQMNGSRKLVIDTNGNTNIIGTATITGALTVNTNGFSLKGWRQYSVQIGAAGSTNTGAIIFRQFQDSVNWNTGGVVVEIINYSYANSEYDTRKDFARYGYSGNAAAINTLYGNVTGKIPQPYWGSAVQGSGVFYYRDLMIDIPPYHAYVISLTTPMSLNGNSTVGNGTIYTFS